MIKFVIVESPYAGDIEANVEYARAACLECINRGETPFASHLFYPQMLNDADDGDRHCGITCGLEIGQGLLWAAEWEKKSRIEGSCMTFLVAFYVDKGWSSGMEAALERYTKLGASCEIRRLKAGASPNGSSQIDPGDE